MNDDRLIRLTNLRRLCEARNLGPTELSIELGSRYTYWRDLLAGEKSFGEKAARRIEEGLELPRGWLDEQGADLPAPTPRFPVDVRLSITDDVDAQAQRMRTRGLIFETETPEDVEEAPSSAPRIAEPPATYAVKPPRPVWVIGKTQGGWPERVWDDAGFPVGGANEFAEVLSMDEHAFVVEVVGDSMAPKYMPGEYALVEPGTSPEIEDDVLVRLVDGKTMLKKLLGRHRGIRLGSYNSPEVLFYEPEQVSWLYYVPHPVPRRKIKDWVDTSEYRGPDRRSRQEPVSTDRRRSDDQLLGGMSSGFGDLDEGQRKKSGGQH